jgi:uncharacterized membrane protein YhhN
MMGLAFFLATHIFYIIFFLANRPVPVSLLKQQPLLPILAIGYTVCLVMLLFPHLGYLKIPVTIYAIAISIMLLSSLHIYHKVNSPSGKLYAVGAALFVLSDSMLAINKFYRPFALSGVLTMLSYCAAQYYIVRGFIKCAAAGYQPTAQ